MADEKTEQTQVTDNQTEVQTETKPEQEQIPASEQEKSFKDKVIGWVKDKFSEESASESVGETADSGETEAQYNQAAEQFVAAAREQGWQDDEIENFAVQYSGAELLEMIPHLQTQKQEQQEDKQIAEKQEDKTEVKDDTDALLEKLLPKLQEKLGITETKTAIEELRAEGESQRFVSDTKRVDELMDDWSKQFPELGLQKDLPVFPAGRNEGKLIPTSPQFKARAELYSYAVPYLREGQSVDKAMTNASYTYKGKYMEKNVERDLIKDLKKHEQRLSGPRTAKEVKKTYANDREEGLDIVRGLLQQQGQEM